VVQVLAAIEELAPMLARAQEVLDEAAASLPKPSRSEVEAMRDLRQPVTPEAFLLARLYFAALAVESAVALLQSSDAECFLALAEAFARNEFPTDLVPFRELATGAGHGDLVARQSLDAAVSEAQANSERGAAQRNPRAEPGKT
jgi:hypothetical protein